MMIITVVLFFICVTAAAAPTDCSSVRPFFYKVERDGKTSYLLGAMRIGVPLQAYPSEVYEAFDKAKWVAFETDNRDISSKLGKHLRQATMIPEGKTLKDFVKPLTLYKLQRIYGPARMEVLIRYRPWVIREQLKGDAMYALILDEGNWSKDEGIDMAFYQDAKKTKKKIEILDKDRDLATYLDAFITGEDLEELMTFPEPFDHAVRCVSSRRSAYCAGDEVKFFDTMNSCATTGLLKFNSERKKDWLPKLVTMFEAGDALAVVGVEHLLGPDGLMEKLREDGFIVSRE